MVADTQSKPHQQQTGPVSAEDEALKRNTDCVYFLASPLTCKKGSECEYRHSEYARVNPRDCWFWLNGNCLNPKCSFRHPPLDGLLGTQAEIPSRPSLALSQPAISASMQVPCNASKQAVPCIFFQQGICFKGDRCAFLHGPNHINNKVSQAPAAPFATESTSSKRNFGGLAKCTQEPKVPQESITRPSEVPSTVKLVGKSPTVPMKNEVSDSQVSRPIAALDVNVRCKQGSATAVMNGNSASQPNRMHPTHVSDDHSFQNGKDVDDSIRESSPGFDVLVDDELGDGDYYCNDDQFGRTRGPEDQFDLARSADYGSMVETDHERFQDIHGFDSYDRMQGYPREHHRSSSERKYLGTSRVERRGYPRDENPDQIAESDLRYRLSKQRKVSGLRSVVSVDYSRERQKDDRSYRGSRRDSPYMAPPDSSISSRFHGRLNLSRRSPPTNGIDLRLERDFDRGRKWGRSSPTKPQIYSQPGSIRDRITGVAEDNFIKRGRNTRGSLYSQDVLLDDGATDFAAPKSLAELKGGKNSESKEFQGKHKNLSRDTPQQSEEDLSFDGPKPLSMILKRKRGAEAGGSEDDASDKKEHNDDRPRGFKTPSADSQPEEETDGKQFHDTEEENKSAPAAQGEKDSLIYGQSAELPNDHAAEDGAILDETEDQELEAYDQRDGEFDYENLDGEYADPDDEYMEEEDGEDDFAKKIGVMLT